MLCTLQRVLALMYYGQSYRVHADLCVCESERAIEREKERDSTGTLEQLLTDHEQSNGIRAALCERETYRECLQKTIAHTLSVLSNEKRTIKQLAFCFTS